MTHERPDVPGTRLAELWRILPEHSGITAEGELELGGVSASALAAEYGTPLFVYDESGLRAQLRRFSQGLRDRWPNAEVIWASKSFPAVGMYRLAAEEGVSIDFAGGGELQLALAAGVSPSKLHFHGNAKSDDELRMALEAGVHTIIVDNVDELDRLDRLLTQPQRLLLRVIPGVEAKTHASQATGGDDAKFGLPLAQAIHAIERMRAHPLMEFEGIHLHIGSQILDASQFAEAVRAIAAFGASLGSLPVYDVGGGLGINYTYSDNAPSIDDYLDTLVAAAREALPETGKFYIEPGRAIVGRAGITLYEVLVTKQTGKSFVAVNGGMSDLLDAALTDQRFEAVLANRMREPWGDPVQLVGRQCESGDLLIDGAPLPPPRVGDLVAVAATGAYAYTLANNYNGALRPAVVFVRDGASRLVARRETYDDFLATHAPSIG